MPSSPPARRRGAQPHNRNAYKHGIFSLHDPVFFPSLLPFKSNLSRLASSTPQSFAESIHALQVDVERMLVSSENAHNANAYLAWVNRMVSAVGHVVRMKAFTCRSLQTSGQLLDVSRHALDLILLAFQRNGITRDADSFREKRGLSDFNSSPKGSPASNLLPLPEPFLDPRQWSILESLLPPSDRTGQRGRPPADPRPLLDAVFWKLAHHARWQDLPSHYPPMLTVRRYYRRLFLSGRLATLYRALYSDLLTRGRVKLPAWVVQGRLLLLDTQVFLHPDVPDSWHSRTALLFMQQGFQVLHSLHPHKAGFFYEDNTVE